jgi:hypothetical protein
MRATYGPVELRITWQPDSEPYQLGDAEDAELTEHYIDLYGVQGCVVETRAPACACCGLTQWEHAASLWSIVGDENYMREIERDLISEV